MNLGFSDLIAVFETVPYHGYSVLWSVLAILCWCLNSQWLFSFTI